ncbi:MAG TPA: hypothetical protein VL126_01960 [Bacteroidota bacterium]|nr:hypothetical protein [Bacteroidota bacterium]
MSQQQHSMDEFRKGTWRLKISLDAPFLRPPAVLWALFPEDPRKRFLDELQKMRSSFQEQVKAVADAAIREQILRSQPAVTWDHLFKSVSGDKVGLLTYALDVVHLISSNDSGGKKWIVTKAVQTRSQVLCWCVPFDAVIGHESALTLNKDNVLNLIELAEGKK